MDLVNGLGQLDPQTAQREQAIREEAEELGRLRAEKDRLNRELKAERSRGFLSRVFGGSSVEDPERTRERMRGRIALALIFSLIFVVLATFGYLLLLSRNFGPLTTDDLNVLIPMVGTTLLMPLVGLIGAVTGFYFGGQTAVQAATQATEAAQQGAETATQAVSRAANQQAQTQAQTAQTVSGVVAQAATRAATQAAQQVVTNAGGVGAANGETSQAGNGATPPRAGNWATPEEAPTEEAPTEAGTQGERATEEAIAEEATAEEATAEETTAREASTEAGSREGPTDIARPPQEPPADR
jgi:hypothetical protein